MDSFLTNKEEYAIIISLIMIATIMTWSAIKDKNDEDQWPKV